MFFNSAAGNRTPVSRVTGGDTNHYTTADILLSTLTPPHHTLMNLRDIYARSHCPRLLVFVIIIEPFVRTRHRR